MSLCYNLNKNKTKIIDRLYVQGLSFMQALKNLLSQLPTSRFKNWIFKVDSWKVLKKDMC